MIIRLYIINRINNLKSKRWSKNEDAIIKENFATIPIEEFSYLLPGRSVNAIKIRGNKFGLHQFSNSKFTQKWTTDEINYIKLNWDKMSDYAISQHIDRTPRAVKAKRQELGLLRQLKNSPLTYDDMNKFLRGNIHSWKINSINSCNGKCVLTGSDRYDVHHLYNFQYILEQYIQLYDIEIKQNVNSYTQLELDYIIKTFNDFHNTFPLGVCVRPDLHKKFHHEYGKKFNSPQQWYEFKEKYMKGKYNH